MANLIRQLIVAVFVVASFQVCAQSNGKLQIHYMDVGQGDGAVLISPLGEIVLFDNGVKGACSKPLAYLEQLGIKSIDYHVSSHYHVDHFGCTSDVLSQFPLKHTAYDRGVKFPSDAVSDPKQPSANSTYAKYVKAVGTKRKEAKIGDVIVLDGGTANPVRIEFVAINGAGVKTQNENDLSVVAKVEFGAFRTEFGGDLSGQNTDNYKDIETPVTKLNIGRLDVYKVHHHCSAYSSNTVWLDASKPTIAIVSTGNGNTYNHPTQSCLSRLHNAGIKKVYWTEEGNGATPDSKFDVVAGSVVVEVAPGEDKFTVTYQGDKVDQYPTIATSDPGKSVVSVAKFSWAKQSPYYHHADCEVAKRIKPENLMTGDEPPTDRQLHKGCPLKK